MFCIFYAVEAHAFTALSMFWGLESIGGGRQGDRWSWWKFKRGSNAQKIIFKMPTTSSSKGKTNKEEDDTKVT